MLGDHPFTLASSLSSSSLPRYIELVELVADLVLTSPRDYLRMLAKSEEASM